MHKLLVCKTKLAQPNPHQVAPLLFGRAWKAQKPSLPRKLACSLGMVDQSECGRTHESQTILELKPIPKEGANKDVVCNGNSKITIYKQVDAMIFGYEQWQIQVQFLSNMPIG